MYDLDVFIQLIPQNCHRITISLFVGIIIVKNYLCLITNLFHFNPHIIMKQKILLFLLSFMSLPVFSQKEKQEKVDSAFTQLVDVLSSLKYEPAGSKIDLGTEGKIVVPKGFKFVNGKQSADILTKVWGNPPGNAPLGMLFHENGSPVDSLNGWAFVIRYEEMGHIKDDDADEINYDDLLKDLKEETEESNKERKSIGYSTVSLLGWASAPFYDKSNKTLHWAKELLFEGEQEKTLNYDVRVLGRKGLFSLNAVGGMKDLPAIKPKINEVIASVNFNEGSRYSDFDPGLDQVAAVGIGGLVAGKVLAKAGFFALLLKFWKIIAAGVVVAFGAVRKFFSKGDNTEE
jgi:uncharacterized membrane-anchored protein